MKVAVSIPDGVFEEADKLAKRLKTSRSEIYARALDSFIGAHSPDRVTAALNEAADQAGAAPDEFVQEAARRVLGRAEW